MSLSRRSAMIVSTLGFAAMFAGGFTYRAYSRGVFGLGVDDAYRPWNEWRSAPLDGPIAYLIGCTVDVAALESAAGNQR